MARREAVEVLHDAHRVQVMGVPLPRLLSLIPLLIYGIGALGILAGSLLGVWQVGFHPDTLFPFEALGLSACAVVCLRG